MLDDADDDNGDATNYTIEGQFIVLPLNHALHSIKTENENSETL